MDLVVSPREPGYFHAIAVDYDGTIAEHGRVDEAALAAISRMRQEGRHVVIVTGRILSELREVFPSVDAAVDLIVAENGAVIARAGVDRALVAPVPRQLDAALSANGVTFRRGQVLLACSGDHESIVLGQVRRLGLECQLVRNRGELMILPPGTSKGVGLFEGLGDLGVSRHNTIAVGDAENDHSLLDVAEVGVAVANAVDALKDHADLVLTLPDGQGISELLNGPVLAGRARVHSTRWRLHLGMAGGEEVTIPASQLNKLVTGPTMRGKSYLAGLVAEQLIRLGYSVLVIDPEGDHVDLGRLRGVFLVGGGGALPSPEDLVRLVHHRFGSVVIDLSTAGYCFVTHRPDDLRVEALLAVDVLLALPRPVEHSGLIDLIAATGSMSRAAARAVIDHMEDGQAVLVERDRPGVARPFSVGVRETTHLRHWHKYSVGGLPPNRRFYFRTDQHTTGATAGSVEELERELRACEMGSVTHHCAGGDFSRWIADVLGDATLGAAVAVVEDDVRNGARSAAQGRHDIVQAIHERTAE